MNSDKWLADGTEAVLREYGYDTYGKVSEIKDYRILSEDGSLVKNPFYTICSYTYDSCQRPVTMTYRDSGAEEVVREAYAYSYDANSRLVSETIQNLYPEKEEERQNEVRDYQYDNLGNLMQTRVTDKASGKERYTLSYAYDAVGNRLSQERTGEGAERTTYVYNSLNQMISSESKTPDGTVVSAKSYTNDGSGNQIKETDTVTGKETLNTYDAAGRLQTCTIQQDGKTTLKQENVYNGSGTRIQKKENGKATNYFYSKGSVLYTTDENGKGTSLNLQGTSGNIIATARKESAGEGYYYYQKDPKGSVTNLRDISGKSVVSYQYTDFGETTICGDTDFYNEICYNEAIYDKSTGLYYLSARYYEPEDGRFLTRDTYRGSAGRPSTWNLYTYCANNPINYEDPSGHFPVAQVIGGTLGAIGGYFVGKRVAKKLNAKGWKKYAIIAGCAAVGGVIGAVAGTKLSSKFGLQGKCKLPNPSKILNAARSGLSKVKSGASKIISKTKQVISKGKKYKSTIKKVMKRVATEGAKGGAKGAAEGYVQSKLTGDDTKKGITSGFFSGAVGGMMGAYRDEVTKQSLKWLYTGATGIASSAVGNLSVGDWPTIKDSIAGAAQSYIGDGLSMLSDSAGITHSMAQGVVGWTGTVFDFAIGVGASCFGSN